MALRQTCLFIVLLLTVQALQASTKHPINDFCRRWGHQTAQVDGKLYIDGGLIAWNPISSNPSNDTNTWLVYSDLNSTTQDIGMPRQYANLTKSNEVPSVAGGILWSDEVNKCFYLYGGEYQSNPADFTFWAYDTILQQWNETKYESNVNAIQRVAYGAGAQANELGYGYYYGGYMSNKTTPGWTGTSLATSNLVRYDYTAGTLQNNTGPDDIGRAEGSMVYLPASDGGLLVYFGGVEDSGGNGSLVAANMSTIHIFDISSSKWYQQAASGSVPPARRQFCAGVTWADDHSSYNIYLYGGFGAGGDDLAFDDSYILSIPSFTWIKAWPTDNSTTKFGHGGCSANVVNRDQMIIIGGWFPSSDNCDSQNGQGQHNMNLGYNGPQQVLWDKYSPNLTTYFVPTPIISVVGGGPTGGATITKPSSWDNPDLAVYFTRVPTFAARSATRSLPSSTGTPSENKRSGSKVGAIAGGVVGGLAGLIAILCIILFCLHRRKKAKKSKEESTEPPSPPPAELPATTPLHELHSPGVNKHIHMQDSSVHSRSPSDHYTHPTPYPSTAYQPIPQAISPSHPAHGTDYPNHYSQQQSPTYPPYSDLASPYDTHHPPQQQCSYPTPISPIPHTFPAPPQNQVYYPPPPDPSVRSHLSYTDTQPSVLRPNTLEPPIPPSTTQTPAQFYAQPVRRNFDDEDTRAGSDQGSFRGFGDPDVGSRSGSIDSRRRPVRGRFVEVDHM
ncbi:hypothetical protein BU24DRAFT_421068 [Aaosphaeria arxii CBS 175.79]|uniref:Galactose oxidase n=1 Tax=Aaosphaeria arxii CBS 175.79 TaxID=1450172 RepID=A0A6A5XYL1_9PLEO|nr:uncharacterized protein BU24DRAFT_421068 [Aaosphaeria arxii CBS 175.79]KAF2018056.1 hypothetical protein BU24DRAFT_421068 [Aaosphaeria arxii CBS 175.79]